MRKAGAVYIMSSENGNLLYTGMTSDLHGRVWQHRVKYYPDSFTAKYNCIKLVYYCGFDNISEAVAEEKRIKAGNRNLKLRLIETIK